VQPRQVLDPDDPAVQRKLYEEIQRRQVQENLELAMEETPEAFSQVVMLYLKSAVNNIPIAAFIDSGAQMTVMSARVAEQCNLTRLIDRRFQGMAKGVGTSRILGRVHMAQVRLGEGANALFLPMSITVLEQNDMDFLIGLDQLKRHHMCIDLASNSLRVGTQSFGFLSEHELPAHLRAEHAAAGAAAEAAGRPSSAGVAATHGLTDEQKDKLTTLITILPHLPPEGARRALEATEWNVDTAVSMLAEDG
jgi:DNA damage-inducible protein 1